MWRMSPAPAKDSAAIPPFRPDRSSPVPLYFQVASHLEQAISSGAIPPGTLFGNEIQLADTMGLSRPTMRRAMQHLVDKGLIVRRRGIGTRVVQPKVRRMLELTSLYDDLSTTGQRPTTRVLSFKHVEADDEVSERLRVAPGDSVVRVERLRSAQDRPIAKMVNYLPDLMVGFDADGLAEHGLYELLRRAGVQLHSASQTVGARNATAAEARLLEESRGAALLTMSRTTFDDRGQVVEYATHLYAASRYSFEIDLLTP
jgi:DNA-binding GntR family transcriptional regulator